MPHKARFAALVRILHGVQVGRLVWLNPERRMAALSLLARRWGIDESGFGYPRLPSNTAGGSRGVE